MASHRRPSIYTIALDSTIPWSMPACSASNSTSTTPNKAHGTGPSIGRISIALQIFLQGIRNPLHDLSLLESHKAPTNRCVQPVAASARKAWRQVADELRSRFPKAAALMDSAEADVLAHLEFPAAHRVKRHSTNTLECLNKEVKRRANVVGIFPNQASIRRLIGAVLMEQNEAWQLQHRYLPQHTMTENSGGADPLPALTVD